MVPFLLKGGYLNFGKLLACELEQCHQKVFRFAIGLKRRAPLIVLYLETVDTQLQLKFYITVLNT